MSSNLNTQQQSEVFLRLWKPPGERELSFSCAEACSEEIGEVKIIVVVKLDWGALVTGKQGEEEGWHGAEKDVAAHLRHVLIQKLFWTPVLLTSFHKCAGRAHLAHSVVHSELCSEDLCLIFLVHITVRLNPQLMIQKAQLKMYKCSNFFLEPCCERSAGCVDWWIAGCLL